MVSIQRGTQSVIKNITYEFKQNLSYSVNTIHFALLN